MTGDEAVLRDVILQARSMVKELALGGVRIEGGLTTLSTFFGYFERPTGTPAPLAAR